MTEFNIKDMVPTIKTLIPRFIWDDKDGHAMAKAIEAGVAHFLRIAQEGLDTWGNIDKMPEWRLDEMAWETNCLYDYGADVEAKRRWIKNAIPLYKLYGTPEAIYRYIGSYFDDVDLEEFWQYGGEPYHFRVTVEGDWTPENEAWARKAINTAKNVRSVLDSIRIGCKCRIGMTAECEVLARFRYPLTSADNWAGRWPQEAYIGVLDNTGKAGVAADGVGYRFPYPMTGTRPEINTIGVVDQSGKAGLRGDATGYPFGYPMTSENARAGTIPQENMVGALDESRAAMTGQAEGHGFPYPITGTKPEINTLAEIDQGAKTGVRGDAEAHRFSYPIAGTTPQENVIGVPGENDIQAAQADDTYARILYKMCGEDEI